MNTAEILEIMEEELSSAKEAYDSDVIVKRLREKDNERDNNESEEERLAGVNSAVEIFKAMRKLGKESCLKCLQDKRMSIRIERSAFLDGFDFVLKLVKVWEQ